MLKNTILAILVFAAAAYAAAISDLVIDHCHPKPLSGDICI